MKVVNLEELLLDLARPNRPGDELAPFATLEQIKNDEVLWNIYQMMEEKAYWAEFYLAFLELFGVSPSKLVPAMTDVEALSMEDRLKAVNDLRSAVVKLVKSEKVKTSGVKSINEKKLKAWLHDQSKLSEELQSPLYKTLMKRKLS